LFFFFLGKKNYEDLVKCPKKGSVFGIVSIQFCRILPSGLSVVRPELENWEEISLLSHRAAVQHRHHCHFIVTKTTYISVTISFTVCLARCDKGITKESKSRNEKRLSLLFDKTAAGGTADRLTTNQQRKAGHCRKTFF